MCDVCAAKWQCGGVKTALVCRFSRNSVTGARARSPHLHHYQTHLDTKIWARNKPLEDHDFLEMLRLLRGFICGEIVARLACLGFFEGGYAPWQPRWRAGLGLRQKVRVCVERYEGSVERLHNPQPLKWMVWRLKDLSVPVGFERTELVGLGCAKTPPARITRCGRQLGHVTHLRTGLLGDPLRGHFEMNQRTATRRYLPRVNLLGMTA